MANLDEYWSQLQSSEKFQGLEMDQKEKVRQHLFSQYVQNAPSYSGLPQSQRLKVQSHFDEMTKLEPDSMAQDLMKRGKNLVKEIQPAINKGKEIVQQIPGAIKKVGEGYDVGVELAKQIEPLPMRKAYEGLTAVSGGIKKGADALATAVEPNFEQTELSNFDVARAAASGGIRTAGEVMAGFVPTNMAQVALFPATDAALKYAGTTFLGADIHLPGWKPKSGLSSAANELGDQFEKIVTRRRIENNGRMMNDGPPRPLEMLAQKEQVLKAQSEVDAYQEWLEQVDKISPSGGVPQGDLYPEAKINVSQLRDMAKERLQKLQDEPVRVESLSKSEDALQGYYRRQIDKSKVYMMPEGPRTEPQAALPAGPQPAGLLKTGEPPKKTPLGRPAPVTMEPPPPSSTPQVAPVESSQISFKAKEAFNKAYQAYYPGETKQANAVRAGAAMKGFGFKPDQELNMNHLDMLGKFMEQEHLDYMARQEAKPAKINPVILEQKGLNPAAVQAEAKRLQAMHQAGQGISEYEQAIRENGGIGMNPADAAGKVPEKEEFIRNVPMHLRGQTAPDQMAQALFDAGLQEDASSSTMYRKLADRKMAGQRRSVKSFLDEAQFRLENEMYQEAGFREPPQQTAVPGTPGAEMPATGLAKTEGQVPQESLMEGFQNQDIQQKPLFDIVTEIGDHFLNEKGQVGPGDELDPVKQAALEANIKELVDRAMALGYETSQDIMLYAARNAPSEVQNALRKNLAPTLSPFDTHGYKEMQAAKDGNAIAKKSMMDSAQRNYFQQKADILKGIYKKFKANQQIVVFKDMDEGLMRLKNDLFIHDNYRKFTKDELAAQRWYTEGQSPKLESLTALDIKEEDAKRWLELAKNPTDNMKKARAMTQIFEDEYHDVLSEFYDRVGYREDHVTRRWKRPEQYMDWEGKILNNRPSFLKGAKLVSQAQGIDAGLEPVSFDIREDLRAANNARVNILSRIHAYQKLGASFGPEGMPALMDESGDALTQAKNAKITPHSGQAPASWIRTNDIPLLRGLAINPYYKDAMKFMMARPFQGTVPDVLDFLSASTKATKLYGFFHGYTLGEMVASGISYRDVFSFSKDHNVLWRGLQYATKAMTADMEGKPLNNNPIKAIGELYDSFMTGHGALANRPLALEMAEHGFKFGSADEDMHGILKKYLIRTENYLKQKIGETPAKALTALPRGAIDIQEKALWSYVRPISSMLVYETNVADAIKKFNLEAVEEAKIPVDQIKQMIVNQTSKEMGGISYARLMINPRTQQVLQWAMLAPGWTIGRALMGASMLEKGPEGRQARKQLAKLFTGWFFASNMINFAQTKKYLGKGRYMWENPEGYRNQAFMSKDKDGTKYIQLSKALTEIYDDLMHPAKTAAYKLSAPVQAAAKVMNWATAKAYYPGIEPENPLMTAVHAYEPMITSGNSAYGGMPTKRGPSKNKVEAILDRYYRGGMKDGALFKEALQVGMEQGYDVGKLDRAVRANRSRKMEREMFK